MPKPPFWSQSKVLDGSKFVPTYHHCGVIGHIWSKCPKLKREQNRVARSLPKKPSRPKHIACHHCGAFGHLRPHCFKFQALKRIKRKEKLKLLGSCVVKAKSVLGENGKLLKKVFDVLTSLSMCISSSHSSNPRLTSLETLIPKQSFHLGSYGWAFTLLVINLILLIFVELFMHYMLHYHAFVYHASLYMHCFCCFCIWSYFYVLVLCE